jgi:hypothetical protein
MVIIADLDYCEVCFAHQHRKGTRKKHTVKKLKRNDAPAKLENQADEGQGLKAVIMRRFSTKKKSPTREHLDEDEMLSAETFLDQLPVSQSFSNYIERSKFIPLRLTYEERKYLRLLEAGLNVCEYTDKIDIIAYSNKNKRIVAQIKEICSILSGLVLAADYNAGQALFKDKDFEHNKKFFQDMFELGRRHKIMNPEKMRDSYGKLIYMLQDSQIPEVQDMLSFSCVRPIVTVFSVLEEKSGLALLEDEVIEVATAEIKDEGRSRREIQAEIKRKERAIEYLAKKYAKNGLETETIRQCLYSIGDNNAFLRTNRDPCEKMIGKSLTYKEYLVKYFDPKKYEENYSLAIQAGRGGARLSHGHEKQYQYVIQSLSLWKEVLHGKLRRKVRNV